MTVYRLENGVSEAAFKQRLDGSGKLLVVCTEAAERARGHLPGGWQFYVLNKASERWAPLHLFRVVKGETKPRLFKTVDGVCGYLMSLGLPAALVPVREGDGYEINMDGTATFRPGVTLD